MKFLRKIIFLMVGLFVGAAQAQDTFSHANELYKQGNFDEAMKNYEQITPHNAAVSYNLGNCAYQLKMYGKALLHWRRAEKQWGLSGRQDIVYNINLLQDELRKQREGEASQPGAVRAAMHSVKNILVSWICFVPLLVLQVVFLFMWFFLFFYLRFLYKRRKKSVILLLFSMIALFGIILVIRYNFDSKQHGVVTTAQAPLLSGPGTTFTLLMQLPEAQEVTIKKESSGYYKVKADGYTGWVAQEYIGVI